MHESDSPERDLADHGLNDDDIARMFTAATPVSDDAEALQARVMMALKLKLWLRQGLVGLTGIVAGIYALLQVLRLPTSNLQATDAVVAEAAGRTDRTLRAGMAAVDDLTRGSLNLLAKDAPGVGYFQTPDFFWVSFAICIVMLGLYFLWSQEEAL
jgi:hypothetical protein